jgi:Flp pilus assembly protein TadG
VAIPLFLLLFGIFDFGRAIYAYNTIADAARQGARTAIVNQDCTAIRTAATKQALALTVASSDIVINFGTPGVACGSTSSIKIGDTVNVTVSYHFSAVTPVIAQLLGPITIGSSTQLPVEFVCPATGETCLRI